MAKLDPGLESLKGMSLDELLGVRVQLDTLIREKGEEEAEAIRARMKKLEEAGISMTAKPAKPKRSGSPEGRPPSGVYIDPTTQKERKVGERGPLPAFLSDALAKGEDASKYLKP